MIQILHPLPALAAIVALVLIAVRDYKTMSVSNRSVGVLLGLYILFAALGGFESVLTDIAGAALLFVITFLMWLLHLMGAGDAKLAVPLGLFMGLDGLVPFSFFLLILSVLALLALKILTLVERSGRLADISRTGRFPYAVLLAAASIPVIFVRAMWFT